MTRKMVIGVALALTVLGGTAVYAGMGCNGSGMFGANADLEKVRTFQKETGNQRDEMMLKRLELSQEMAKTAPDQARVAALRQELLNLRTSLQGTASKLGLTGGCLTNCDQDPLDCGQMGNCDKQGMRGKHKKQMGGCNNCEKFTK
jgi:hypothetical protein